jgi:hypothetical protein
VATTASPTDDTGTHLLLQHELFAAGQQLVDLLALGERLGLQRGHLGGRGGRAVQR